MAASLVGLGIALGTNPAAHAQHAHELTASLGLDLVAQWACSGHACPLARMAASKSTGPP